MMFEIIDVPSKGEKFIIQNENDVNAYLHSDGSVFKTPEYWPTRKDAQAVLNKFQPKHVWKHGDVFELSKGTILIYLVGEHEEELVFKISGYGFTAHNDNQTAAYWLRGATFLFNIKEKL